MAGEEAGPLSAARRRVLRVLQDAAEPLTLAALSQRTGSHPNTLRDHLGGLIEDGYAQSVTVPPGPGRRGRPRLAYLVVGTSPPEAGAASLLDALLAEVDGHADGDDLALRAGERWGATLAGGGKPDLMGHLAALGFAPEAVDGGILLRECPLTEAATAAPGVVCRMHLGAILRLLPEASGADLVRDGHPEGCLLRFGTSTTP